MISIEEIKKAREVIRDTVVHTPVLELELPDQKTNLFLKCENLQLSGSFKVRGALYRMSQLSAQEKENGVIAWSAGNHAQGVALAAKKAGVKATICIPSLGSISKIEATKSYGARVVLSNGNFEDAKAEAMEIQKEEGLTIIHPFDDDAIIAGQGTIGLEILEQLPSVENVVVPVGGGGLISGIALAIKTLKPSCKIYGVEAESVPSMRESVSRGEATEVVSLRTIADGIAVKKPGDLTLEYVKKYVDEIVTVSDYELMEAFLLLVEKHKLVAENSGILPLAGLKKLDCKGKKAVAIVSGGNIDVLTISSMINKGLVLRGRIFTFSVNLPDKPGQLVAVSEMLADADANVIKLDHNQFKNLDRFHEVELQVTVETNGEEHIKHIIDTFKNNGYIIKRLNSSEILSE